MAGYALKGTGRSSAVKNYGNFTLMDSSEDGSGTLTGPTSLENDVYEGGGVYNSGTFTMTGGSISSNTADSGGGVPTDEHEYAEGDVATVLGAEGLSLEGYHFTGWNTAAGGSGKAYQAGEGLKISGSVTLYAQWEPDGDEQQSGDDQSGSGEQQSGDDQSGSGEQQSGDSASSTGGDEYSGEDQSAGDDGQNDRSFF